MKSNKCTWWGWRKHRRVYSADFTALCTKINRSKDQNRELSATDDFRSIFISVFLRRFPCVTIWLQRREWNGQNARFIYPADSTNNRVFLGYCLRSNIVQSPCTNDCACCLNYMKVNKPGLRSFSFSLIFTNMSSLPSALMNSRYTWIHGT